MCETPMIIGQHMWSIVKIKRRLTWWYWKRYVVLFQMVRHVSTKEEQLGSYELFFSFFSSLFSLSLSQISHQSFQKLNILCQFIFVLILILILLITICFAFNAQLIIFSISFLNILFYLIFLSHLIPIIIFLIYFIFQFSPSLFSFI
jgi:pilus assembly protein TadC